MMRGDRRAHLVDVEAAEDVDAAQHDGGARQRDLSVIGSADGRLRLVEADAVCIVMKLRRVLDAACGREDHRAGSRNVAADGDGPGIEMVMCGEGRQGEENDTESDQTGESRAHTFLLY